MIGRAGFFSLLASSIALALCGADAAHAQAPASAASPNDARTITRRLVLVRFVGPEEQRVLLDASTRELLARLGLSLETLRIDALVTPPPAADPATLAMVDVDLAGDKAATVVVTDARTGAVVARRAVTRDRSSSVVIDAVAHIVHATVEELVDVAPRDKPPPVAAPPSAIEPPPPTKPPASVPAEPDRVSTPPSAGAGLDIGAFAVGRGFGQGIAFGGGLLASVGFARARRGPALWLSGAYHAPFDAAAQRELVDARVSVLALRGGATLELAGGPSWRLELGPQAGADVLWTSASSSTVPQSRVLSSSREASMTVGAALLARFAVAQSADVFVAVFGDVDLAPHRYVVLRGSEREVVFETWRVRPAAAFGFTFDVVGPPLYAESTRRSR